MVDFRDYSINSLVSANLPVGQPAQLIPSQLDLADRLFSKID